MRAFALILFAAVAVALLVFGPALVGAALAAEDAPAGGGLANAGWAEVQTALVGVLLVFIAIVGRRVPGLVEAWFVARTAAWQAEAAANVEIATTARVTRIDTALDDAIAAGATPAEAADSVADKLPQTLQRSKKDRTDITREAAVKKGAADRPDRA